MAKELYEIRLTNPCQQNWQGMEASAAGRFCSACEKEVIDFTQFSNQQLIDYFVANKIKEGCGRFLKPQIAAIKIPVDSQVFQKPIPKWKKFLLVLLVCFGKNLFNAEVVFSQRIENDSVRFSIVCDSSLPSETFDINDTLKIGEIKTPEVVTEPESTKIETNFFISDSFFTEPVTLELDDTIYSTVLGNFIVYPENKCTIPFLEMIEDSPTAMDSGTVILSGPANKPTPVVKEHAPFADGIPEKKKGDHKIPVAAILNEDNKNKRKRKQQGLLK